MSHRDVGTFWEITRPILSADPVRHTSMLSVGGQLARGARYTDAEPILLTVHGDSRDSDGRDGDDNETELRGAAICTPPFPLNVSALPSDAAPDVVRHLVADDVRRRDVSAIRGPNPEVDAFTAAWVAETGDEPQVTMNDRLYRLGELLPPAGVPGEFRLLPDLADEIFPLIAGWRADFEWEAMDRVVTPDGAAKQILGTIASGGWFGLWIADGRPVAMAAATGPVEAMSRIGSVYTPPVERGHGYGAAVTSAVCRWVLDHGARDVVLHADLANPVSNAIYQRIGFQAVHDGRIVAFGPHN